MTYLEPRDFGKSRKLKQKNTVEGEGWKEWRIRRLSSYSYVKKQKHNCGQ